MVHERTCHISQPITNQQSRSGTLQIMRIKSCKSTRMLFEQTFERMCRQGHNSHEKLSDQRRNHNNHTKNAQRIPTKNCHSEVKIPILMLRTFLLRSTNQIANKWLSSGEKLKGHSQTIGKVEKVVFGGLFCALCHQPPMA